MPKADAISLTKSLVAWFVWADRHNRSDLLRQIINNLRSIGLARVTGFQPQGMTSPQWIPAFARAFGIDAAEALLEAQGLRGEIFMALAKIVAKGREKGDAEIWALGRMGARVPVYGPADTVLSPELVSPIVRELAAAKWRRPAATALALAQMARRSGDRARDLSDGMREAAAGRLDEADEGVGLATLVREVGEPDAQLGARIVADSLPSGLRIAVASPATTPEPVSGITPGPPDIRR
ncbi:MAG: hypothetical protein ABGY42_01485 [bacterium]